MTRVVDELVENALRELADEQQQRRLWTATEGPEVSSFDECLSRLWDDSGLGVALEKAGKVFDDEIDDHLRRLDCTLRGVDSMRPVDLLLVDPRLVEARELARHLLDELRRFGRDAATSSLAWIFRDRDCLA